MVGLDPLTTPLRHNHQLETTQLQISPWSNTSTNKLTTRWEGPQSLSYQKYSLSKDGLLCTDSCVIEFVKSKQAYMTRAKVMSSLRDKINQKLLTIKRTPSPWPARCPKIWHLYVWPIYQHSHHHKSNCPKAWPACTQIWDPYVCMTHIPALTPS